MITAIRQRAIVGLLLGMVLLTGCGYAWAAVGVLSAENPAHSAASATLTEPTSQNYLPLVIRALSSGRWQTLASTTAPLPRHENGYVQYGNKFYLIGGRGIKAVQIYDPTADVWVNGGPTPLELHHFQAVVYDNRIIIAGAFTGPFPYEDSVPHMWRYDPASDGWEQGPAIERPRGSAAAVVSGDTLYLLGGTVGGHGEHATTQTWFDAYDFVSGTWTQLPDAPHARDHFHVAIVDDKLYAIAGRDGGSADFANNPIVPVDVFDFTTGVWSTLPSPAGDVPTPRSGAALGVLGAELILAGGEGFGQAWDTTEALDTTTGLWRPLSPLNQARHGTQIVTCGDTLFLAAGSGAQGGSPELSSQEQFFFTTPTACGE